MFENAHPNFQRWFISLEDEAKQAVVTFYQSLKSDPDIAHGSNNAEYAYLAALMRWCAETYGYDFRP